jgi:hypothetical protein
MSSFWRKVAAICVAAAAIAASVAIATAATGGGGNGNGNGNDNGNFKPRLFKSELPPGGPDEHFSALAKELGVSTSELRKALDAVHEKLDPPRPPSGPPTRAQLEKRCNELTEVLAEELDKSADEVRDATKAVIKAEIEDAVKDKKLTRSQADRMLDKLDDAACLPMLGRGLAVHRCGPPPGARRGLEKGAMVLPAPPARERTLEFGPEA